jgi:hypothetical protein
MSMNITIHSVRNASDLPEFVPVEGQWALHCLSEDRTRESVEESVRNWMDAEFPVRVSVYHADGREITGDMPSEGTFLATRI